LLMQAAHQLASVSYGQVRFEIERLQQLAVKFSRVGAVTCIDSQAAPSQRCGYIILCAQGIASGDGYFRTRLMQKPSKISRLGFQVDRHRNTSSAQGAVLEVAPPKRIECVGVKRYPFDLALPFRSQRNV